MRIRGGGGGGGGGVGGGGGGGGGGVGGGGGGCPLATFILTKNKGQTYPEPQILSIIHKDDPFLLLCCASLREIAPFEDCRIAPYSAAW